MTCSRSPACRRMRSARTSPASTTRRTSWWRWPATSSTTRSSTASSAASGAAPQATCRRASRPTAPSVLSPWCGARRSRRTSSSACAPSIATTPTGSRSRCSTTCSVVACRAVCSRRSARRRGLAYSVYSYKSAFAGAGALSAYVGTSPDHAKEVLDLVNAEFDHLAADGVTERELEVAKGHLKGSMALSLEDSSSRMSRVGRSQLIHGEIMSIDETVGHIDAVQQADLRARRRAGARQRAGDGRRRPVRRRRPRPVAPNALPELATNRWIPAGCTRTRRWGAELHAYAPRHGHPGRCVRGGRADGADRVRRGRCRLRARGGGAGRPVRRRSRHRHRPPGDARRRRRGGRRLHRSRCGTRERGVVRRARRARGHRHIGVHRRRRRATSAGCSPTATA